jgi:hypothetical protein
LGEIFCHLLTKKSKCHSYTIKILNFFKKNCEKDVQMSQDLEGFLFYFLKLPYFDKKTLTATTIVFQ